jgi:hypothetical protein
MRSEDGKVDFFSVEDHCHLQREIQQGLNEWKAAGYSWDGMLIVCRIGRPVSANRVPQCCSGYDAGLA